MPAANLQTVLVPKALAPTRDEAREIARKHANRIYTSREAPNYWRFRQRPLKDFKKGKRYWRTYEVPDSGGVKQVFGTLTESAKKKVTKKKTSKKKTSKKKTSKKKVTKKKAKRGAKKNPRAPGKTLDRPHVVIYRARSAASPTFETNDYVTLSRKWATEHAQHQAAYEGEPQIVIRAMVKGDLVAEAYNPGEYFYTGEPLQGRIIKTVRPPYEGNPGGAGPAGPLPNPSRRRSFEAPAAPGMQRWETSITLVGQAPDGERLAQLATRVEEFSESSTMVGRFAQAVQERAERLGLPCAEMAPLDCTQYLIGRYRPEPEPAPELERWRDTTIAEGEQATLFRAKNPHAPPPKNPRVMPDPGACAWLGSLLEWKWKARGPKGMEVLWEPERPMLFLWSPTLKAVVAVPAIESGAMARRAKVSRKDGGAKIFERFSARDAKATWGIQIPRGPIKRLGDAIHIVYRSDKWNPPHEVDYIHDFGKGVRLYCGPNLRDPEVFLCFGGRLTATERGLVY